MASPPARTFACWWTVRRHADSTTWTQSGVGTAVLTALSCHVGPEVLEPVGWHEKSWHRDENDGGGYIALTRPGTTEGLLPVPSSPVGDVHWAGAETASHHAGYLDGAVESGVRAAYEVIEALGR